MKKQLIYWLLGERAGRLLTATWNWLWGIPVEMGGKVAVEVANESLSSMQESVRKFTQSVAQISASYQRVKAKYDEKCQEFKLAEQQAILAQKSGNEAAARLAMSKAISIERLLPQLAERVTQAEQVMKDHKERLTREQHRLETYKLELNNIKSIAEINEALAEISKANQTLDTGSARSQFEEAQSAVEKQYLKSNAFAQLSENPSERLSAELDQMTIDDEVSRRLQQLSQQSKNL